MNDSLYVKTYDIPIVTSILIIAGITPYAGIIYTCFNVPSPSVIDVTRKLQTMNKINIAKKPTTTAPISISSTFVY